MKDFPKNKKNLNFSERSKSQIDPSKSILKKIKEIQIVKEIKKQQESLSNFKEALDKSASVIITNAKGNIIYVNDDFCKISQFSKEELISKLDNACSNGNNGKSKYKITFLTNNGWMRIHTTIWMVGEEFILLKENIYIPINSIIDVI